MTRLPSPLVAFALLSLISHTYQVDVTFVNGNLWTPPDVTTCLDLLPGQCCRNHFYGQHIAVTWHGLQAGDVSVIWGRRITRMVMFAGCDGIVLQTGNTPGRWDYNSAHSHPDDYSFGPSGASYIRLPPKLPPDQLEADWLNVEGMRALVWGGGKWVASSGGGGGGASGVLGPRSDDDDGAEMMTMMMRPQISKNRALYRGGRFWASTPPGLRFPDLITVNGSVYSAVGRNGTVYKDAAGNLLDVKALR
ncbi:hypothetical protein Q9189_006831, partial [Teloschistes chrysophthalmus]